MARKDAILSMRQILIMRRDALLAAAVLQVTLGISTLLLHVPTPLASTHQAGALLLLTVVLFVNHRLIYARD